MKWNRLLCFFFIMKLLCTVVSAQPVANFTVKESSGCGNLAAVFTDLSTGNPIKWSWSFGDGNTSSYQNPSTFYSTPGTYTVSLTVTDVNGKKNTITKTNYITVHQLPSSQFTADVTTGCLPLIVNFTDQSTVGSTGLKSWYWDFGDGSFSTAQNSAHTFTSAGTYQVSLEVTDSFGCSKEKVVSSYISVLGLPSVGFSSTGTEACAVPFTVNYNNTSDTGLTFLWDFGTAGTSTSVNLSKTFSAFGSYNVYLTGTNVNGCASTFGPMQVNIIPFVANFSLSTNTPCVNSPLTFTDQSAPYVNSWLWDFGDNSTPLTQNNPDHTYSNSGSYTVTLTAGSNLGCVDTEVKTVTVYPLPDIYFSVSDSTACDIPFDVTFNDNTNAAVSWEWDIDHPDTSIADTFTVDYTGKTFIHTYDTTGLYAVKLKVTDANGCINTSVKNNYIDTYLPFASITSNKSGGCIPLDVTFHDTSSSNEPIIAWSWDFGDPVSGSNNVSTLPDPIHTYNDTGFYTITLSFTDIGGCSKSKQYGVEAGMPPIIYGVEIEDATICFADSLFISDSSSNYTDAGEWLYKIDLDSGKWAWYPPNTTIPFKLDYFVGSWTLDTGYVSIAHIDYHNACPSDTAFYMNLFSVSVPRASWDITDDVICEKDTPWTNQPFILEEAYVDHYLWDFGDSIASGINNYSTERDPSPHVYTSPGGYTITLTISNDSTACSYTQTKSMFISDIDVSITLDATSLSGCKYSTFTFHNTTTSNSDIYAWAWMFGDSPIPSAWDDINANFLNLPFNGTYYLTNYDIAYWDYAEANFSTSPTDSAYIPINDTAYYKADSTLYTGTYLDPFHAYDSSGVYSVRLVVVDADGCIDTTTLSNIIKIFDHPVSQYSQDITSGCAPLEIGYTDNTFTGAAPLVGWEWDFGDGYIVDSIQNPSHTFTSPGVYPVTLTVTDANDCSTSVTKIEGATVTKPYPSILYTANDCYYNSTFFNNTSIGANLTYTWNFGDGSPIDTVNVSPYHQFDVDSNESFIISLHAVDTNGCDSLYTQTINIFRPIAGYFLTDQQNNCPPFFASFVDTGSSFINTWAYNFGDGSTVSLSSILDADTVSHVYSQSGFYDVSLVVTDSVGCVDTLILNDYVQIDGALGTFDYTPKEGTCPPVEVTFMPANVSNAASYLWIFGDGASSNIEDTITHSYTQGGYFTPVLILEDTINYALGDSVSCVFVVIPDSSLFIEGSVLDFDFTGSDTSCTPYSVSFTNLSNSTSIDFWLWNFGDTTTSIDMNPTHFFGDTGTYSVTLTGIEYDNDTCTFEITKNNLIAVLSPPQVNYVLSNADSCPPLEVQFVVDEPSLLYPVNTYYWDFGDGDTSSLQNPGHLYDKSGTYVANLYISYFNGCEDSSAFQTTVNIFPSPTASFVVNPEIKGTDLKYLYFNNTSTFGDSFIWDFGDGSGSTEEFPMYRYNSEGEYIIQLIVLTDDGCTDTTYQTEYFYFDPELANSFSPNGDGINDYFTLQVTGQLDDFQLEVFNRWGMEVFKDEDYNNKWDGKDNNGKQLAPGTYYFVLNYQSKTVWAGWLRIF